MATNGTIYTGYAINIQTGFILQCFGNVVENHFKVKIIAVTLYTTPLLNALLSLGTPN